MNDAGDGQLTFDNVTTFPRLSTVEDWIEDTEDEINDHCRDAWKSVVVTEEPHRHEGWQKPYGGGYAGFIYVKLKYSNIFTLASGSGDKLEINNGSSYEDLLVTGTAGAVYGDGDFFVDTKKGIIYIHGRAPVPGPTAVKVTYRYGNQSVPRTVKRACILLAAKYFLSGDDYISLFPDNPNAIALESKAQEFNKRAFRMLRRYIRTRSF
jgi:hypothetical protein